MHPTGTTPPVLLVDDDPGVRDLLEAWLLDEGYAVIGCAGAVAALEALESLEESIVVADLSMPGMDGLSLCRALRAPGRQRTPYLLVLTGTSDPSAIEAAFEAGVDDLVRKPIGRMEFLGRMRVAERISRLAGEAFERSQRELERRIHQAGMSELREVVATLAHDLRTPIAALRTSAEMIAWKAEKSAPELAPGIARLVDIAVHLSETVTDVADAFVCDDLDPLRESWKEFDLVAECLRTLDLVRAKVSYGVTLVGPDPSRSVAARGNPPGLRRLAMNLLANALRATRTGEVRLELDVDSDPDFVEISVVDTGGGIPPEILPFLGEPLMLSSGSATRKRSVHGAGLGLAICRRIVAQHGGRMLVSTRSGEGTRIRAWIRKDLDEPRLETDYCRLDTEVVP